MRTYTALNTHKLIILAALLIVSFSTYTQNARAAGSFSDTYNPSAVGYGSSAEESGNGFSAHAAVQPQSTGDYVCYSSPFTGTGETCFDNRARNAEYRKGYQSQGGTSRTGSSGVTKTPEEHAAALEARLKSIDGLRARLQELLAQLKKDKGNMDGHQGTTPSVPNDSCSGRSLDSINVRTCGGHATSTLVVLSPNGGESFTAVGPTDNLSYIAWKAPVGMATVDIDLIKDGTVVMSLGKNIPATGGQRTVIYSVGGGNIGSSNQNYQQGRGVQYTNNVWNRKSDMLKTGHVNVSLPIGTGYKIRVTGKIDSVQYTDESNAAFQVVAGVQEGSRSGAFQSERQKSF